MKILLYLSFIILSGATVIPPDQLSNLMKKLMAPLPMPNLGGVLPALSKGNYTNKLGWLLPFLGDETLGKINYSNICIFSRKPSEYKPKCFLCPDAAYETILLTCQKAESAPNNVSFSQAECMESNCAINYPTDGEAISYPVRVRRQSSNQSQFQKNLVLYTNGNSTNDLPHAKKSEAMDHLSSTKRSGSLISAEKLLTLLPSQYKNLHLSESDLIAAAINNASVTDSLPLGKQTVNGTEYQISGTKVLFLVPDEMFVSE